MPEAECKRDLIASGEHELIHSPTAPPLTRRNTENSAEHLPIYSRWSAPGVIRLPRSQVASVTDDLSEGTLESHEKIVEEHRHEKNTRTIVGSRHGRHMPTGDEKDGRVVRYDIGDLDSRIDDLRE